MFFWNKKLTEREFTEKLIKQIPKLLKGINVKHVNNLELHVKLKEGDNPYRMFLHNAYNEYLNEPKSLYDIIGRHISSLSDSLIPEDTFGINDILPVIKGPDFLRGIERINPGGLRFHVYEQYNSELFIFYAIDQPNSIAYLVHEQLGKLGVSPDELRQLACKNLFERFEIKRNGGETLFMLTLGGDYEASTLLLDIWNKETFPVKGNIVLGIPARDTVLVTGSTDSAGLHKMYDLVQQITKEGNYPVSDKLFEWNGDKFEVFSL